MASIISYIITLGMGGNPISSFMPPAGNIFTLDVIQQRTLNQILRQLAQNAGYTENALTSLIGQDDPSPTEQRIMSQILKQASIKTGYTEEALSQDIGSQISGLDLYAAEQRLLDEVLQKLALAFGYTETALRLNLQQS